MRYKKSAKRKYLKSIFLSNIFTFFRETLILKGMTGSLDKGIYKELSSFTGSLSGFTPKPSSPKQFPIIKTKIENVDKTNPKWQYAHQEDGGKFFIMQCIKSSFCLKEVMYAEYMSLKKT